MTKLTRNQLVSFSLFVLLASLTGCCSVPAVSTSFPDVSPTSLSTAASVPATMPELPTSLPTPSPIPPTRTPRPTPVPTMTDDEEYTFVSEMLQDNGGCQLPCWWGFVPGETSSQEVQAFFTSQGKEIVNYGDPHDYTIPFHSPDRYDHSQYYIEKDGVIETIQIHAVPSAGEDGYYDYEDPLFAKDWGFYMLPQILEDYGLPQQVFLETHDSGPDKLPFRLLLFYADQGFLVMYEGNTGKQGDGTWVDAGQMIHLCPWRSEVALWLWSPEQKMSFEDVGAMIESAVSVERLRLLEEATGMSIEQFYDIFVQPGNQECLETPAELW